MKNIYMIGIKGVGMTALAKVFSEMGYCVKGSDNAAVYVTDEILEKNSIEIFSPFSKENLKRDIDMVVVSAAYGEDNIEVEAARRQGMKVVYYSEALQMVARNRKIIAVSGVHGKTTTTSLVALLLTNAELDPGYIIGAGNVPQLGTNAHLGQGKYFIIEADEYRKSPTDLRPKFLDLSPEIAIISSIELDHPDIFPTLEDIYQAFVKFTANLSKDGLLILNNDYPKTRAIKELLTDKKVVTYGFSLDSDWRIENVSENVRTTFELIKYGEKIGPFEISMPGKHNVLNALTAIIIGDYLGIPQQIIKETLISFTGVQRRFEILLKRDDLILIDDYAHHPTAIANTLSAVKEKFPDYKIYCIFQPHTYSRTEVLLNEFANALSLADDTIVTDIYTSEREKAGKITSVDLVKAAPNDHLKYFSDWMKIKEYLKGKVRGKSVIITIGAGDIYKLAQNFLTKF